MRGFDHGYLASDPGVDVVAMDPPPPALAGLVAAEFAGAKRIANHVWSASGAVGGFLTGVPWRVLGPVLLDTGGHESTNSTAHAIALR
jgi:hypothetical protein